MTRKQNSAWTIREWKNKTRPRKKRNEFAVLAIHQMPSLAYSIGNTVGGRWGGETGADETVSTGWSCVRQQGHCLSCASPAGRLNF